MFESFLRKNFWQSLFTGTAGSGRTRFTFEELRALSDVLNKNQVVTEANRALVVETIRSIAEFMIWGDQNEPRIFDYFLENNIMHYLHSVLQQPANRSGDVAKQVLQTLSIIIQNIRSETGTYFLFSNNHINNIVEIRFDFEDEEVLGYYISFLKTISLKLNARTVQFFFDRRESDCTFPLYSEAVKFAHHKEGMVRAGVRTLTLNVYSVPDEHIQDFVCQPQATAYFAEMAGYIADQIKILDKRMTAAEGFSTQVLSSLDSQLAEVEDMVSYVADILATAHPRLAHLVAEQLWVSLIGPYLLRPLLEYGSSKGTSRSYSGAGAGNAGIIDLAESIGTLDIALEPVVPRLQSTASSSDLGSGCINSSGTATTPAGAPEDASAPAIPPSVLDSSSCGPGQPETSEVNVDAAPTGLHQNVTRSGTEEVVVTQPPPPPPAPVPPPPAPAPLLAGPPCAAHARPVAVADSTDVLDALFALLSMQLLPVTGLWHVGHLLQQLYPHAQEQHDLNKQQQLPQQQSQGTETAEPLGQALSGLLDDASCTACEANVVSPSGVGLLQGQPHSPPCSLDPGSATGWACELNCSQREALRVACVSAASAVLDEVGGMWCDALVAILVMEWPTAHDAVMRPVLRTGAEQLMAGPHLYPRQTTRSPSAASRNDQGLGGSAVAALHSYHAVSRLVALLLVHNLLCKGTTERTPPATVPPPAGTDVEGREWDVLEGQEVELQADSAIPCIVSFSPGQERRVYFAAAGPALRRVGEYLQNPQVLLSDTGSQSVVLYSSPAVVLADPAPTRLNAGIVLSVSPLMGCDPSVDKNVPKWLHVHVRPSVRGLLRLLRSAAGGRKGGLLGALRHLVDGHWVLAFPDAERAGNARQLVEQSAHRLRALYCELLSPVLSTVME
ncbi:hypothetical protein Vretimale_3711 [Volvox reticuliferus]|uniref:FPL domain-containing protein n=1 Tax=Volvox reticuliferus TaxID=1737510 RepID=A0A8J4G4U6_9CHLO|nr:hypothetical protein Vretimale_3711 [Volvox reticuliferus]